MPLSPPPTSPSFCISPFLAFLPLSLCFFSPSSTLSLSLPSSVTGELAWPFSPRGLFKLPTRGCVLGPFFCRETACLSLQPARLCPLPWAEVMDGGNYGQQASIRALPAPGTGGPQRGSLITVWPSNGERPTAVGLGCRTSEHQRSAVVQV